MQKQKPIFKRKQLVIAVSIAMLGGAMTGCSSSSSTSTPAGTATIVANGGVGGSQDGGEGGYGGEISLYNGGASGGVAIQTTGTANTAFTTPITPAQTNLGPNPLMITADTTIKAVAVTNIISDTAGSFTAGDLYVGTDDVMRSSAAGGAASYASDPIVAAGTSYINYNDGYIYKASGTVVSDDTEIYSGLSVAAGVTLTLGYPASYTCSSNIRLANDIDNSGTITKEAGGCSLSFYAANYNASGDIATAGNVDYENGGGVYINAGSGISNKGKINTSGFDDTTVNGGGYGGSIYLVAGGYVINSGMLDTNGGDGLGQGGNGGEVSMYAAYTENDGGIDTSGGNNVSDPSMLVYGYGGNGGYVNLGSTYVTNNTADMDTSGGDGSGGGYGGNVGLYNDVVGEVKNAGNLTTNGGVALQDYTGGRAGNIYMDTNGGSTLNSGSLSAVGGNSTDPAGYGGDGGQLSMWADGGECCGYGFGGEHAPGDVVVSGNINFSGGSATADGTGDGGNAGSLDLGMHPNDMGIAGQSVQLLGYVSIDANGGDAAYGGEGSGGYPYCCSNNYYGIDLYADAYQTNQQVVFAGSVTNNVPINAHGGSSTADAMIGGFGGEGGKVSMATSDWDGVSELNVTATNSAAIDVSGANGVGDATVNSYGGLGGGFELSAYSNANNSGDVNGSGGNGGKYGSYGGYYYCCGPDNIRGAVTIASVAGQAINSGAIDNSGGDGAEQGGNGFYVNIYGASAANSGDINVNGGNASDVSETYDANGGDGGEVTISGIGLSAPASNSGNVTYSFGTGQDQNGEDGCLQVGLTFTGNCISGGSL
jgi:hypothetical protein